MASSNESIAPPPPYRQGDANDEDLLDRLVHAADGERGIGADSTTESSNVQQETKRVKNFIQYVLSIDYQRVIRVALSSADRSHFTKLHTTLCDLREAQETIVATADERRQMTPYFWRYLHAPCKVLGIPTEYVVLMMSRFVKYQTSEGLYKGCCFGILHNSGLEELAIKLYIDAEAIIPRVTEGDTRKVMVRAVRGFMSLYFHEISGIEGAISRIHADRRWFDSQTIEYRANQRGKAYEEERQECVESSRLPLSTCHWTARVKKVMQAIKDRHAAVKNGRREPDPMWSWRGPVPMGVDPEERRKQRHAPYAWRWKVGQFLPDLFESRSSRSRRDASEL
ncbi:hypothetical protein PRZ48_005058 [Zasmidium cellare]|uniref:Uncharacterized protein n=1 Tax=Zasmidium cellare TaxID=395010 RepID=A0ABR0ERN8_ZASCE|nr:hypothetical protein PRZ48_005058 [Zasmidium cellare]